MGNIRDSITRRAASRGEAVRPPTPFRVTPPRPRHERLRPIATSRRGQRWRSMRCQLALGWWPLAAAFIAALAAPPLSAQTIGVQLGDSARLSVTPGGKLTVPVQLDMSAAAGGNLASFTGGLTWNAARLTLDSLRAGTGDITLTSNLTGASGGTVTLGLFTSTGLTASTVLARAYFTAASLTGPVGSRVTLAPTVAGNESGSSLVNLLRVRSVDVCIAAVGAWGDVTDDGQVNIIDAQQIARHSVGLAVANSVVLAGRGDVTADGAINIIDAQQIARFSVGLSAAARINTALAHIPTVNTLAVTPSGAQLLPPGGTVTVTAVPRDAAEADLTGCAPVVYTSSNPSVASVSDAGVVTGVSPGSATITVTAGGQTQSLAVTVQPLYTLVVATQPSAGTSNELLPRQPVVQLRDGSNALVTAGGQSVTVSIASGNGALSGTTTVPVVNGVAAFTDLAVTGTGAHALRFSAVGALDATSASVMLETPNTMRLLVGQTPTQVGTAGTDVVLPLILDLSGRGSQDLASVQATITWDPAAYSYVSNGAGTWVDQAGDAATITVNATQVAAGTFTVVGFTNEATVTTGVLRTLTLRPVATGPLVVNGQVTAAGNAVGQSVTVGVRPLGLVSSSASVASVRLTPAAATVGVGEHVDLSATPLDANGAALSGRSVTFSTSAPTIATVTSTGRVTGLSVGTATITATSEGRTASATITVNELVPGLSASYYVIPSETEVLPEYRGMVPYRTGAVPTLNYPIASADTNFAGSGRDDFVGAVFEGFLEIPTAGSWTLALESDDGAKLYINDALVVANDGVHPPIERSGTVTLAAGRHRLRVDYFEQGGGAILVLRAQGPGFSRQVVPSNMLWRRAETSQSMAVPYMVLSVGQTTTPIVTVRGADGTVVASPSVTWGTTAPTVATVTSSGSVTATGPGTAYIVASASGGRAVGMRVNVLMPLAPPNSWSKVTSSVPSGAIGDGRSYDRVRNRLYIKSFVSYLGAIDLTTGAVTELPASGWIGRMDHFVVDPTGTWLYGWEAGRSSVYRIPTSGGTWTLVFGAGADHLHYEATSYWNPLKAGVGLFGGYGFGTMNNSIYELDNMEGAWTLKRENTSTGEPPRSWFWSTFDSTGTRLYAAGRAGNVSGRQGVCTLSITQSSDFCWARGIWMVNLADYSVSTIRLLDDPLIRNEGPIALDEHRNRLYLVGGREYPAGATDASQAVWTNKVFKMDIGVDSAWVEVSTSGSPPPVLGDFGSVVYDPTVRRLLWLRTDGLWALAL